jgi:DNA-binding GntR family transcriptional regulator
MAQLQVGNEVYGKLRDMILAHRLRPGEKLVDRVLAERLGVSRTPVREAFGRLEQVGLVTNRTGRGYFVADIDIKQVADLYDLREILEVKAIELACEHARARDLDDLASVITTIEVLRGRPEKIGEEIRVGLRLHEIIARASGNGALHEVISRLLDRMMIFVWMEVVHEDHHADVTHREHVAMVRLIQEKAAAEAAQVVRGHIRAAKAHILRVMRARESFFDSAL